MPARDLTARPLELVRGFLSEREDPERFYVQLAERTVRELPHSLEGQRILDLGSGPGWFATAMAERGATVIGLDLDEGDIRAAHEAGVSAVVGDGRYLPFPDDTFDGVLCSNLLEHTPTPSPILADCARVTRPGGWVWMSWTVWFSPWGGHAIAPYHYFGPHLGVKVRTALKGPPTGKNLPYIRLWPTHVGQVLTAAGAIDALELRDAYPRYWPSQRWILRVPGLREFLTWNCVLDFTVRDLSPAAQRQR